MLLKVDTEDKELIILGDFNIDLMWNIYNKMSGWMMNKGNNKITELRTILQRESQNS
jgi:hypothetical protein